MDRAMWDQLKLLRDRTGAGLSDCRQALAEVQGNLDDAVELIRTGHVHTNLERFLCPAQVHAAVSPDARTAVLIEFAAPHRPRDHAEVLEPFFAEVLAVAARTPPGADLGVQPLGGATIGAAAAALSTQLGLPIAVRRWARVDVAPGAGGRCAGHVHPRRELGAIVVVTTPSAAAAAHPATKRFADELAIRINRKPTVIARADLDPALVAVARARLAQEAASLLTQSPVTPDDVHSWQHRSYELWVLRRVLLLQAWDREADSTTIEARRKAASLEAGGELCIARFAWFERGNEGCIV